MNDLGAIKCDFEKKKRPRLDSQTAPKAENYLGNLMIVPKRVEKRFECTL